MLDTLRDEVGEDVVEELVELFETESRTRLEAIDGFLRIGDRASLSAAAHSMKGSALNLGAETLASLCARLEKTDDDAEVQRLVPEVRAEFERIRGVFVVAVRGA